MDASPTYPFRSEEARAMYIAAYDKFAELWPVPSETRTVSTSYGETFVRISGPADAPPLVLLHGLRSSGLSWMHNVEALSALYRTYAPDTPHDYGRSVGTKLMPEGKDHACWLDELFSALKLGDEINLVGMSLGGWQAGQYLMHHPERLRRVVLMAPGGTVQRVSSQFMARLMLAQLPFAFLGRSLINWLFRDLANSGEQGSMAIRRYIARGAAARAAFTRLPFSHVTVLNDDELKRVTVPTLFLVGEHEVLYPAQKAVQRLNSVAPQIKTEIITGAGHDLPIVQAEVVNQKILAFLQ